MKIFLATDHAGFEAKEKVKEFLVQKGYDAEDCGAYTFDPEDDYPDFIAKAAEEVSKDPDSSKAIIFGGSGQGENIVANKFKNIRSVVFYGDNIDIIKVFREHNNANILSIGVRFTKEEITLQAVDVFLKTQFSGEERHIRRIGKIEDIEDKK
ncbi:MAG: ribose-5-phosphate isomerase [Candidatus Levybacteria bacterium RIFCSPHIGHO2_12_FULL_38_12]|nr:MAG: ribose-5-phosphate isomerase [Candidatus Levybacteria bacterium RIFCSPHIGHO2_01_FULL_38_12]OGH22181.1 MAG: ribose-5-phosphate isomerase [Candidatus Levybacteria bacterium RIFCSPHIGHO2_02_FULL_37_18]OGH22198.1 MAG: ribose-5-phosphate isomerase [Candidatus Levybacteria bacterium RIFCSPHIGHO2_12_FULL_38_12]OGH34362.1 MAG: ribose-5-phosphate isomerase [Candidatus Levybacteria bacterium RIFCSPLOWO2_01_FULL_37_20]OGH44244.1 MAG: ribose-5-phosphate isomerase [Candidatus Levybacteria bacterium 